MRILAVMSLAVAAFAQTPAFDVASVKPAPWTGAGNASVGVFAHGDTLDAEHASLRTLIEFAYNLREDQLSGGPPWADARQMKLNEAQLYQVIGKVTSDTPPSSDMFRRMLQTLLAERFQLQVHHTQKDLPIYNLVVDKGGPKLTHSAAEAKFKSVTSPAGKNAANMEVSAMTMAKLAQTLSLYAGRPVFDKSGLDGGYDFTLKFAFENLADPDAAADAPRIFTAVREQLGLRLDPATAPFDCVVIDHAERPEAN